MAGLFLCRNKRVKMFDHVFELMLTLSADYHKTCLQQLHEIKNCECDYVSLQAETKLIDSWLLQFDQRAEWVALISVDADVIRVCRLVHWWKDGFIFTCAISSRPHCSDPLCLTVFFLLFWVSQSFLLCLPTCLPERVGLGGVAELGLSDSPAPKRPQKSALVLSPHSVYPPLLKGGTRDGWRTD